MRDNFSEASATRIALLMYNREKMISIKFEGDYVAVVNVYDKKERSGFSSSAYETGTHLFAVLIAAHSTKELEKRIGQLQEAVAHQGWTTQ